MKRTLYWVNKDLRINDNAALNLASKSDHLLCVYVVDKQSFAANKFQSKPLGATRWRFLQDCLDDFNQSLSTLGQELYIVYGDTLSTLTRLCENYQITDVITTKLPSTYENRLMTQLSEQLPELIINQVDQFTLFTKDSLPFELEQLPVSYSKFRKKMAEVTIAEPVPTVQSLPSMFDTLPAPTRFKPEWLPTASATKTEQGFEFEGGEQQGLKHLRQYFSSNSPAEYKQVRNNLDGWKNSSKLSPWLNSGCISVRQVIRFLTDFEQQRGKNDSTECLYLELLWREYYQWVHCKVGAKTYQFKGLAKSPPLTTFYPERFNKWCLGNTPYPLVNAFMHELRQTGYLSNRGRQIVASCLVNELSVDWRYGAAWFEEQLIDYDAAVNWGNWQYIAGVGVDPRGGRHFNIEKQTTLYDPKGDYQAKWIDQSQQSAQANQALDSVDASDWPVRQ
ncbi:DASH family cryptochrome [Colwellia sp. C1TZA3]|uniref:DASH family cryptochrome n=1 Tax=Colwellia sp. C1TZA3 TaxID=2508879 RepID=UPI0011BA28EA|nr:DASH family cryptochrome [Colwellia sp. C1TZA3]TWX72620.1 DASH family cryptochrome [Colwellia sp. C1TZA3]